MGIVVLLVLLSSMEGECAADGLQYSIDTLQASIVYPQGTLVKHMKTSAKNFEQKMPKNCLYKMTFTKTVMANGRYREFVGYKGLQRVHDWNNNPKLTAANKISDYNSHYFWYPFSQIRSESWEGDRDEPLEEAAINAKISGDYETRTNITYDNTKSSEEIISIMRTLEVLSPLNSKHVNDFDYSVNKIFEDGSPEIVSFVTKESAFPRKTRLYGSGNMVFNNDGTIRKIEMTDYHDYWANYPYQAIKGVSRLATSHSTSISFVYYQDHYYPSSINVVTEWNKTKAGGTYALLINPRRHPYRVNLKESLYLELTDPVEIPRNCDIPLLDAGILTGYAPYIRDVWENGLPHWLDSTKIIRDLNINEESFWEQCDKPLEYDANNIFRNRHTGLPLSSEEKLKASQTLQDAYSRLQLYYMN